MDLGNNTKRLNKKIKFEIIYIFIYLASVPIVPPLTNEEDTSNFDEIEKTDGPTEESFSVSKTFAGNQLSFVGFSFSSEQQ